MIKARGGGKHQIFSFDIYIYIYERAPEDGQV